MAYAKTAPIYCTIPELVRLTGISRSTVYLRLTAGDFPAVKSGHRTLIDAGAALAWLDAQPAWKPQLGGGARVKGAKYPATQGSATPPV